MKKILFCLFAVFCLASCEQYVSREFGGNTTIKLQPGEKLVEVTWKDDAINGYTTGFYDTIKEAEMTIKMDRNDLRKKTIINVYKC